MAKLIINDLPESLELDRKAMQEILGGGRSTALSRSELNRQKGGKTTFIKRLKNMR